MLDYEGYLERGGTLTETKFQDSYRKALPIFDDITRYRRECDGWDALEEMYEDEIAGALMSIIDSVPAIETAKSRAIENDGILSFNNGITSMSFTSSNGEANETKAEKRVKSDVAASLPLDLVGRCIGC